MKQRDLLLNKIEKKIGEILEEWNFSSNFIRNQIYMLPDELDQSIPLWFKNLPLIPDLKIPISHEKPL